MAPLLSDDKDIARSYLELFERHVKAFRAAKTSNNADTLKLTEKSPFNDPYMVAAIHFAEQTNFESVNHKLAEMVGVVWRDAILQTKINEDCNQKIKDCQVRNDSNKASKYFTLWRIPTKRTC